MTQAAVERGAASVHRPDRWTRAVVGVLFRVEVATSPTRETCLGCGCLCLPLEVCPGCRAAALTNVPANHDRANRRRSA